MNKIIVMLAVLSFGGVAMANETVKNDNSAKNKVYNSEANATAESQSNDASSLELTRKIRSSLTSDKHLSINAQNVKIITHDGKVTLVGPVKSMAEKATVERIAKNHAGTVPVESQITIAK